MTKENLKKHLENLKYTGDLIKTESEFLELLKESIRNELSHEDLEKAIDERQKLIIKNSIPQEDILNKLIGTVLRRLTTEQQITMMIILMRENTFIGNMITLFEKRLRESSTIEEK